MPKIVVTEPLNLLRDQKKRLEKLGTLTFYDALPPTPEEWLQRCKGADVICTGKTGFREKWEQLHDVFLSVPYVGVGFVNRDILKAHGVTLSISPGCNRHAVSEWVVGMMLLVSRQLATYLNIKTLTHPPALTTGLAYKKITILGKGQVGEKIGTICKALEMQVRYFQRQDQLTNTVKDADIVVNALSSNPSTENMLNAAFFSALKDGAMFITITGESVVDTSAMLAALDNGKLSSVVHDAGDIQLGDTAAPLYQTLLKHPNVYAVPHLSYDTDVTQRISNDMMIENIEAWLKGQPIHVY